MLRARERRERREEGKKGIESANFRNSERLNPGRLLYQSESNKPGGGVISMRRFSISTMGTIDSTKGIKTVLG
jgi:hypothetical protein